MRTRLVLGALIAFVSACGGSTPMNGTGGGAGGGTGGGGGSGGSKVDAGKKDAGLTPVDAGNQSVDSGQPFDAGAEVDAGLPVDAGQPVDAGNQPVDSGTQVDAGNPFDAGVLDAGTGTVDAGAPDAGAALITWVALTGPRRGPIELTFTLAVTDFTAFVLKVDKGGFVSTTVLSTERVGNTLTVMWDSFSDLSTDGVVSLKLEGTRVAGNAVAALQLDVRNGPSPDRLISVAQALEPTTSGGVAPTGRGVSLVKWSPVDGGIALSRFDTVDAVQRIRAAPHGRSTAVLGKSELLLVKTPLNADTLSATMTAKVTVPGAPIDLHWSHDGRFLYVMTGLDNGRQPTLERFRVKEDQSAIEPAVTVVGIDRPPLRFDIDPSGRFVIVVGSGPSASTGKLLLLEADGGSAASPIDRNWGLPSALSVSPRGDLVVMTHFLFAHEVFIIALGPSGFGSVLTRTDISAPYDVRFDPRSDSTTRNFVVSRFEDDRLTSVTVSGAVTVHPAVTGLTAPGELDFIERGAQVSTGFSTAFQRIYAFNVDTGGVIQSLRLVTNFGSAVTEDPTGIAVQR